MNRNHVHQEFPDREQYDKIMSDVNIEILSERHRQDAKWGFQNHDMGTWLMILVEEVGEVAEAMQVLKGWGKPTDAQELYKECIQLSAVAARIAEQIKAETERGS